MICEVVPERKINWSVAKTVTGLSILSAERALRCQFKKKKKGVFEVRSFEKNSL